MVGVTLLMLADVIWKVLTQYHFLFLHVIDTTHTDEYMSPGIYIYPFETDLPAELPTSCEGKFGFIRYLASANIIRSNATAQTQTIAFTVIKPHNLNALPVVQVRQVNQDGPQTHAPQNRRLSD